MKLLTREQNDYVMAEIRQRDWSTTCTDDVEHIISRILMHCTEKEFPELTLCDDDKFELLKLEHVEDEGVKLTVSVGECMVNPPVPIAVHAREMLLDPESLKEFTKGCQKIVEWLDLNVEK